ncbi:alpha/beta hydrolase [Acetobacterium sp.]|uniref:alpha/beta hydrolase n=1 Tax=Acetobacterium sp. TaxID=1872094 RepID=UPI002F3EB985
MKVTNKMIDKQLRLTGKLMDLIIHASSETEFLKNAQRNQKILNKFFAGKNIKELKSSEKLIPRKKDESKLRIRIYKPLNPKQDVPGVLWIHGGGYAFGVPEQDEVMYKKLIQESNCVIVAPDYRVSIDEPYPAALEDCYEALLWMKINAKELGIRENQLMVGGDSSGGGLTAALTLYARDKGEVNIAFQMPLYPMIDDRMISESAKDNNAPIWNSDSNRWAWKLYLGELYGKDVPAYAAPARATDYSNLPPTATFIGDLEPFRDETIQYVVNLRKAGVPVDFEMYEGCYHAFHAVNSRADISKKAISFFINSFNYAVAHYFAEQK